MHEPVAPLSKAERAQVALILAKTLGEMKDGALTGAMPRPVAARYLGLKVSELTELEDQGEGPVSVWLGRRRVYRRTDLDRYLASATERRTRP